MWSALGGLVGFLVIALGLLYANINDSLKTKADKDLVITREEVLDTIDRNLKPDQVKVDGIEKKLVRIDQSFNEFQKEQREQFAEFQKQQLQMQSYQVRNNLLLEQLIKQKD